MEKLKGKYNDPNLTYEKIEEKANNIIIEELRKRSPTPSQQQYKRRKETIR